MGQAQSPLQAARPGRFKRGFGIGMSQHHGGLMGYHEGEDAFDELAAAAGRDHFQHGTGIWEPTAT